MLLLHLPPTRICVPITVALILFTWACKINIFHPLISPYFVRSGPQEMVCHVPLWLWTISTPSVYEDLCTHSHSINIYRYIYQNTESYITKINHHSEILSQFFSIFAENRANVCASSFQIYENACQDSSTRSISPFSSCCTVTIRKWLSIKLWRHRPAFLIQLNSTIYDIIQDSFYSGIRCRCSYTNNY